MRSGNSVWRAWRVERLRLPKLLRGSNKRWNSTNAFHMGGHGARSEDDQLERRIDSALAAWESRPDVLVPAGPTVGELEEELASVESLLEGVEASDTHQAPDDSGGLFVTLFRAIRTFFASLLRLFGVGPREPSMHPERRQAQEERRGFIQERITARQDADRRWEESTQRVREAADGIQEAALAAELTASSPGEASAALFEWRGRRTDRLKEIDDQMKDWDELQQILGRSSLDELAGEVERLGAEARALSKEVGEEDMADLPVPLTNTEFSHAEREVSETRTAFNLAQGQLEVFARELIDVAEAKEALDAAEDEHSRVRGARPHAGLDDQVPRAGRGTGSPKRRASFRRDSARVAS